LRLAEQYGLEALHAATLRTLALIHLQRGDADHSFASISDAERLLPPLDRHSRARLLLTRAEILIVTEQLGAALNVLEETDSLVRGGCLRMESAMLALSKSAALWAAGRRTEAISLLADAKNANAIPECVEIVDEIDWKLGAAPALSLLMP
jgi:ATP/maltotriose-dependent transcriptional regulator MalT